MKFETYKSTPALGCIPAADRYAAYCATHQRLMREDEAYRKSHHRYLSSVITAAFLPCAVWIGSGTLGTVVSLVLSCISVAAILFLAWRQQRQMNRSIGRFLQE